MQEVGWDFSLALPLFWCRQIDSTLLNLKKVFYMCLLCIISLESLLSTWNNSVSNVLSCKGLSLLSTTTMELHLTVCIRCAKQITASKSVWSSQVTLVLQAELTVSSVHVFTKYFTRVLKQFSLILVVLIKAHSWVQAWPVSVCLTVFSCSE